MYTDVDVALSLYTFPLHIDSSETNNIWASDLARKKKQPKLPPRLPKTSTKKVKQSSVPAKVCKISPLIYLW